MSLSRKLLIVLLFAIITGPVRAQIYVFGGGHESYIRNNVLKNESPLFSWHTGGGARFHLSHDRENIVVNAEAAFVEKGYKQILGGKECTFHFSYLTYQFTVGYQAFPFLSVKGGLNTAVMIGANLKKWTKTYNVLDLGLVAGADVLENKPVGFYARAVYGLIPMVDYHDIDAQGNFNGKIHDLKNTCFMIGLRVTIHEKKIFLRH